MTTSTQVRRVADQIADLIQGDVVRPDSPNYDDVRRSWNPDLGLNPALIVRPRDADSVALVAQVAQAAGLPIAVRSGGHNQGGFGSIDDGILIDLRHLNGIEIDPVRRIALALPGLTWGDYAATAHEYGLATPSGDTAQVGVGGLTLGGGVGLLSRRYGLTIDSLQEIDVVTLDGRRITANADEHPDLYWAMRGGGGSFGIAVGYRFALHPAGTVLGGPIAYPATVELLRAYADAAAAAPDELSLLSLVIQAPPLPFLPPEVYGTPIVLMVACAVGDPAAGEAALKPFRSLGGIKPLADGIGLLPYPELFRFTTEGSVSRHNAGRAGLMDALDDATIAAIVEYCHRPASRYSGVQIRVLGGAIARVPAGETAFSHREKQILFSILSRWDADSEEEAARNWNWVDAFWREVAPRVPAAFLNFMPDATPERLRQAFTPEAFARLAEIEHRYDPDNQIRLAPSYVDA